jgi:LPXTG-motif cell wall-anchored protein
VVSAGMHGYFWLVLGLFAAAGAIGYLHRRRKK